MDRVLLHRKPDRRRSSHPHGPSCATDEGKEDRTDFVREAVERELKRRERRIRPTDAE